MNSQTFNSSQIVLFFQLKRDALASSESTLSHKRRKMTYCSPECEDFVCTPSTPADITCMSSADTSNAAQINLESPDDPIELCTPSTSRETPCIPVTDLPSSYLASDNTTARLSTPSTTPSTTPTTSLKTSDADSQGCKGCIHRKKCHNLQRAISDWREQWQNWRKLLKNFIV